MSHGNEHLDGAVMDVVSAMFANGAEMVVVVDEPECMRIRTLRLDGLRKMTGEENLERAAGLVDEGRLADFLTLSAIDAALGGPWERQG
jgi:hypothetical protein